MPRKRIHWTEEKIEKYIKEGRGQGEGADYVPWLKVGDFSSQGRGHRIYDHKIGRVHHFFSDLEANCYYRAIWSDSVIDIREQFPLLPRSETEQIADELGYRHPRGIGLKVNEVMTTDLLLTIQENGKTSYKALYVKCKAEFGNRRTCEKREIEERYWQNRGVSLGAVTEDSINPIMVKNIKLLLGHYVEPQLEGIDSQQLRELEVYLEPIINGAARYELSENYRNTNQITDYCNQSFGMHMLQTGVKGRDVKEIIRNRLEHTLSELKAGDERVAIILPRCVRKADYIDNAQLPSRISSLMGSEIDNGRIAVVYVDEVKGVEFDRVFVVPNGMTKNEKYIAYTRALSDLTIVYDDELDEVDSEDVSTSSLQADDNAESIVSEHESPEDYAPNVRIGKLEIKRQADKLQ